MKPKAKKQVAVKTSGASKKPKAAPAVKKQGVLGVSKPKSVKVKQASNAKYGGTTGRMGSEGIYSRGEVVPKSGRKTTHSGDWGAE